MSRSYEPKTERIVAMEVAGKPLFTASRWLTLLVHAFVCGALVQCFPTVAMAQAVAFVNQFSDENFDQWVFQHHRTAAKARAHMQSQASLVVENINRSCELTDAQKLKLQLAGRGDVKRFFDSYEKVKQKFRLIKNDQQRVNEIWQDISPLQIKMNAGLFHDRSLLHKTIRNTLTDEQFEKYSKVARETRLFQHRAMIELVVEVIEQGVPLTQKQRKELVAFVLAETKPPRNSGQYAYYVVLYQMTKVPEEKWKLMLDDIQWKVFKRQLDQGRQIEQWLRQSGQLVDDDDDDDDDDDEEDEEDEADDETAELLRN